MPIDVQSLTLQETDKLLQKLQKQLEESQKQSIDEIVSEKFHSQWAEISERMDSDFQKNIKEKEERIYVYTAIEHVLQKEIGETNTKLFLKVANDCLNSKSFKSTYKFYTRIQDSTVRAIARFSFAALQFRFGKMKRYDFMAVMKDCKNITSEIDKIYNQYNNLNVLSF